MTKLKWSFALVLAIALSVCALNSKPASLVPAHSSNVTVQQGEFVSFTLLDANPATFTLPAGHPWTGSIYGVETQFPGGYSFGVSVDNPPATFEFTR